MNGLISKISNLWSPTWSPQIFVTVRTPAELGRDFEYSGTHAEFHKLVIQRIYHEDNLFSTRANILLAVHAFLVTAFAILMAEFMTGNPWNVTGDLMGKITEGTRDSEKEMFLWAFAAALALFGALLGIFQAAMGRQTKSSIGLWREYARLIEARCGIPFDHLQYDFYADAHVPTPFGPVEKKDAAQESLYQLFKTTRFTTSTVCMIGMILPAGLGLFWAAVFGYAINQLTDSPLNGAIAGLLLLLCGGFVLHGRLAEPWTKESQLEPRT